MYRTTAEIVSGSKVFAGGKWLKCIGNKRVSVGERIWTDGRCVYGHYQEAQQPVIFSGADGYISGNDITDDDTAIPILAGKQCYIFCHGKLQLIGELDKEYSLMINDTRGNVFVYDNDTGARIDGNTREELCAANIDKAGNHYYLTQIYENIDDDISTFDDLRILKNGEVVYICSSVGNFAEEIYDSVAVPSLDGIPLKEASGEPMQRWNDQISSVNRDGHFIENTECWSLFQDIFVERFARYGDGDTMRRNACSEDQYIFCDKKTVLQHSTSSFDRIDITGYYTPTPVSYESPITWDSATFALQDGFYCQAKAAPIIEDAIASDGETAHYEHNNFHKTFFSPQGEEILEIDGRTPENSLITRVAGGYLFYLTDFYYGGNVSPKTVSIPSEAFDNNLSYPASSYYKEGLYLYKNDTLELIYPSVEVRYTNSTPRFHVIGDKIINQRLRPMKNYKNWHKRIKEINLNQTA